MARELVDDELWEIVRPLLPPPPPVDVPEVSASHAPVVLRLHRMFVTAGVITSGIDNVRCRRSSQCHRSASRSPDFRQQALESFKDRTPRACAGQLYLFHAEAYKRCGNQLGLRLYMDRWRLLEAR